MDAGPQTHRDLGGFVALANPDEQHKEHEGDDNLNERAHVTALLEKIVLPQHCVDL